MLNLLTEPLIRVRLMDGRVVSASLPGVLDLLTGDGVAEFPALRPHQRQAWHAFLVQAATMALHRAGKSEPPEGAAEWARLLRGLTPDWPNDEPWSLVAPPDLPALLQAPVPGGNLTGFKTIPTPDALDMLVTSKNHDLKTEVMAAAAPNDWLFALVTVQTMDGQMGRGNYGISRMNGGFGSRPCVGVVPPGGPGARFCRDVRVLLRGRSKVLEHAPFLKGDDGVELVWLEHWNGNEQILPDQLDPFYIEVCRRVRLQAATGTLSAIGTSSKNARIAATGLKGNVGDPWTPIELSEGKALSITERGFSYRLMSELILGERYSRSLLQRIELDDPSEGLAILACAIARGQGKTEGYQERIVPISKTVVEGFFRRSTEPLANLAEARVNTVAKMRDDVLKRALFSLLQNGPDRLDFGANATAVRVDHWLRRLDRFADETFFEDLWREAEADGTERPIARREWLTDLRDTALKLLDGAARSIPAATMRRYRARVRARGLFFARLYASDNFPDLRLEGTDVDPA